MVRRWMRVAVFVVVAALAGVPALASAQSNFPSQQGGGGNFPSQQSGGGNFPSQGQQAGRGGVFQSQAFGFNFEWGPDWELIGQDSQPGFEAVAIGNGVSTIMVMGADISQSPVSPQQFVEDAANGLEIADLQFAQVIFDETDRAAAVYESQSLGAGIFLDAIRRDPTTMIVVFWQFPLDQFDSEIEAFDAVTSGLTF